MPVFSIITPVYNGANFLQETIESVLNSGYEDFELIIVDDGSTDGSAEIIEKYRLKNESQINVYFHKDRSNLGVSESRQLGVTNATGQYIYFLDADDLILPSTLGRYENLFHQFPEISLIHSRVDLISDLDNAPDFEKVFNIGDTDRQYKLLDEAYFLKKNKICNSTVCIRRNVLLKFKFNFPQIYQVEDWVLWSLIAEGSKFYYSHEKAISYRYHIHSASYQVSTRKSLYEAYTKIEMNLALISLLKTDAIRNKVYNVLHDNLNSLFKIYSSENYSLMSGLKDEDVLLKRIRTLELNNKKLEDRLENKYSAKTLLSVIKSKLFQN
jgi:glycosyltransferase involved in cell wall biosynthesis